MTLVARTREVGSPRRVKYENRMSNYINSVLKPNSEIHNWSTRFGNLNFHCPVFKKNTAKGGRTFSVQTIRNWNELSMDVKKVKNVKSFTEKLYTNFIAKQNKTGKFEYLLNSF